MPDEQTTRMVDGSLDFSYGVDSSRTTTIQGENNPNGLPRNALAWLVNGTVRGGGITQRTGWQPVCSIHDSEGLYQGGIMYEQTTALPTLVVAISGRFYRIRVDTDNSIEDITGFAVMPPTEPLYHFVQGEEFMVVQSGDYATLPAIWDGGITAMRQSHGLPGGELPAAGTMVYYQGRLWYAYYRAFTGGDIVKGPSGTAGYEKRDSILHVTENPLAIGGDGFGVPTQAGNIRAMQYSANLDSALGQGTLFVFTRKEVYALDVPIDRADWIAADSNNQPLQRVVQRNNGGVSDRSVVGVNGDLYYQSLEPGIRSLMTALRYFGQPGNTPISTNLERALAFNDRGLMIFSSGVEFNQRLLNCILPEQTDQGVIHKAIAALDFEPLGSMQIKADTQPSWDGPWEGLDIFQLFRGDFGGRERCFAVVRSRYDASFELWELTDNSRRDNGDERVNWAVEFPHYTWGREFDLKRLDGGEIWLDKIFGTVHGTVKYRVDGDPCWQFWHAFEVCSARTCAEDNFAVCRPYPLEEDYRELGKRIVLPVPPLPSCQPMENRPVDIGFQFQVRVELKGWCRIRGLMLYGLPVLKEPFQGLVTPPGPMAVNTSF